MVSSSESSAVGLRRTVGLILGPALFGTMLLLDPPGAMAPGAWHTAAVGILMATWWITEAIPIPATALLPLVLFPVLGTASIGDAAAPYANPIIFLFLGGFILALAMQRWELHRRVALTVVLALGTRPHRLVLGFMVATAGLSMWVSNTATTVMMMPIGLSVIALVARPDGEGASELPGRLNFGTALMLGIAYAASIGGIGTLIGTPPNAFMAGYLQTSYGYEIGFARWMLVGVPLSAIALPLAWLVLTRLAFPIRIQGVPGGRARIREELRELGAVSPGERRVGVVFLLTAAAWITRPLLDAYVPGLSDAGIAMTAALALFLLPVHWRSGTFVMTWEDTADLPWGVLLLFGGGLSLAATVTSSGLAEAIGTGLAGLEAWPTAILVITVTGVIVFLTELTSNIATTAAFLPILGPLAVALGENPLLLVIPAALGASCAFMIPVATPPNAIVYGSGYITVPQMVRAGIGLNLLLIALISALAYTVILWIFGIDLGVVPAWAS
jgi:sodium-dependent dicarboxylate transporter 2/3/5